MAAPNKSAVLAFWLEVIGYDWFRGVFGLTPSQKPSAPIASEPQSSLITGDPFSIFTHADLEEILATKRSVAMIWWSRKVAAEEIQKHARSFAQLRAQSLDGTPAEQAAMELFLQRQFITAIDSVEVLLAALDRKIIEERLHPRYEPASQITIDVTPWRMPPFLRFLLGCGILIVWIIFGLIAGGVYAQFGKASPIYIPPFLLLVGVWIWVFGRIFGWATYD